MNLGRDLEGQEKKPVNYQRVQSLSPGTGTKSRGMSGEVPGNVRGIAYSPSNLVRADFAELRDRVNLESSN